MSVGCLRLVFSHAVRGVYGGSGSCGYWTPASSLLICSRSPNIFTPSWRWSLFSTSANDTEQTRSPKKKKKNPLAQALVNNIGHSVPHCHLQVISETGENMGTMKRADAIKLMDEQGLKLVLLSERKDPPVYRLMSSKQIHEEQLKLQQKEKDKAGPVQVKEVIFTSEIATHDLTIKMKQVKNWLEKKHHVKMTLRSGQANATVTLDVTLGQMVEQIDALVGFASKPRLIRGGKMATCVVRPPTETELLRHEKNRLKAKAAQSNDSTSQTTTQPSTSTLTTADTKGDPE